MLRFSEAGRTARVPETSRWLPMKSHLMDPLQTPLGNVTRRTKDLWIDSIPDPWLEVSL